MVPSDLRLALDGIGAPAAVIDLAAFDTNLAALAKRARGLSSRVATKSLRTLAASERALRHPAYSGVLAYAVPEAVTLHARGTRDIVIGYPRLDREGLAELLADAEALGDITVMIDSVAHLDVIDDVRRQIDEAGEGVAEAGRAAPAQDRAPAEAAAQARGA